MPSTLSPLAQARRDAVLKLAQHLQELSQAFLNDLSDPDNQDEAAFQGVEWDCLSQIMARAALGIARETAATINIQAE